MLTDPETHILADGGRILFAIRIADDGVECAVGTVALKHEGEGVYELTKMAVEPGHRGEGIGRKLMEGALDAFRRARGRELFLESQHQTGPALALYESVGFRHHPAPRPGSHYSRADVYMVWEPDRRRAVLNTAAASPAVRPDGSRRYSASKRQLEYDGIRRQSTIGVDHWAAVLGRWSCENGNGGWCPTFGSLLRPRL